MIVFYLLLSVWGSWYDEWSGYNWQHRWAVSDGWCNIAVVPVQGDITLEPILFEGSEYVMTNADDAARLIEQAVWDENIAGLLVRIDSYGGYPVAGEVITNAVKRSGLPSAALIREAGASSAYMIASAADTIIASPISDVGSIGVTMSYTGKWEENAAHGLTYVDLSSAPFKNAGDPNKPLSAAERALFERDLKIVHDHFVKMVADNRDVPLEKVTALADGSTMPGVLALESGLIDQLGDQETAREWFASRLDIPADEVIFCE